MSLSLIYLPQRMQVIVLATLLTAGCEKKTASDTRPSERPNNLAVSKSPVKLDACTLITRGEIQAIQESPVTDSKSSENTDGVFYISQCYYSTAEGNRSVSLAVTQSLGPNQRSPKEFWKESFGRYERDPRQTEDEHESTSRRPSEENEQERETAAEKIDGIGDSAYWTGDQVGGALYVLKRNSFIRISIGGRDSQEGKIRKTKILAEKVLSRF